MRSEVLTEAKSWMLVFRVTDSNASDKYTALRMKMETVWSSKKLASTWHCKPEDATGTL
jgi:hypothetical protein